MTNMDTKYFLALICAVLMLSGCRETPEGYVISGVVSDQKEGTVYLKSFRNKMFFDVDSAALVDGAFTFKGSVEQPLLFGIATGEMRSPHQFFLENVKMDVAMAARGNEFTVGNSPANELFLGFADRVHEEGFSIAEFVSANPGSPVAAFYLYRYFTYQLPLNELKAVRAKLSPALNTSPYVSGLDGIIAQLEHVQVGQEAPGFTLPDTAGVAVSLKDFRGKYVLLDFWAAWCPPCRKENPNVVRTFNEFKDKNFTVVGVSLDYNRAGWLKAIADDGLTWTHVSDLKYWDSEIPALYGVRGIPANYLLDPNGVIIARDVMGEELADILREHIK